MKQLERYQVQFWMQCKVILINFALSTLCFLVFSTTCMGQFFDKKALLHASASFNLSNYATPVIRTKAKFRYKGVKRIDGMSYSKVSFKNKLEHSKSAKQVYYVLLKDSVIYCYDRKTAKTHTLFDFRQHANSWKFHTHIGGQIYYNVRLIGTEVIANSQVFVYEFDWGNNPSSDQVLIQQVRISPTMGLLTAELLCTSNGVTVKVLFREVE